MYDDKILVKVIQDLNTIPTKWTAFGLMRLVNHNNTFIKVEEEGRL